MEATFRFYDQQLNPLGTIKCDTTSARFQALMQRGYSYTRSSGGTGTNYDTYNRLDSAGQFAQLEATESDAGQATLVR